jgi:plastocyanin
MRTTWAIAVVGALLLSACGGDDGAEPSTDLEAVATEYAFDPDSWTVPEGETITLELANEGAEEHEWVIIEQGTTLESSTDFEEQLVVWEAEAGPGETVSETFTAPSTGTYQVICALPGHLEGGMEGTLEVVAS